MGWGRRELQYQAAPAPTIAWGGTLSAGASTTFINEFVRVGKFIHWNLSIIFVSLSGTGASITITPHPSLRAKAGSGGASGVGPLHMIFSESSLPHVMLAAFSEDGLTITAIKTPSNANLSSPSFVQIQLSAFYRGA